MFHDLLENNLNIKHCSKYSDAETQMGYLGWLTEGESSTIFGAALRGAVKEAFTNSSLQFPFHSLMAYTRVNINAALQIDKVIVSVADDYGSIFLQMLTDSYDGMPSEFSSTIILFSGELYFGNPMAFLRKLKKLNLVTFEELTPMMYATRKSIDWIRQIEPTLLYYIMEDESIKDEGYEANVAYALALVKLYPALKNHEIIKELPVYVSGDTIDEVRDEVRVQRAVMSAEEAAAGDWAYTEYREVHYAFRLPENWEDIIDSITLGS